ncbi:MAG: polysaccharide pyruvyl transferase family protein [Pseudomonadota bacterium]
MALNNVLLAQWYSEVRNFGDCLTPYMIRRFTGSTPVNLLPCWRGLNLFRHSWGRPETVFALCQRFGISNLSEYVLAGSILGWGDWRDDVQVVWGAGFMDEEARLRHRPRLLAAVRGARTLDQLPPAWRSEVSALGDPGVLIGDLVANRPPSQNGVIGLIPHHQQRHLPVVKALADCDHVMLIDVGDDVETVVRAIARCEVVVSSAMHGVIAADSLGRPNRWIRLDDGPLPPGGQFKFQDYFSVTGHGQDVPDRVSCIASLMAAADKAIARDVRAIKADLMRTMPLPKPAVSSRPHPVPAAAA